MKIRDRIKDFRRVKASELAPSPKNWRTHPKAQRDAIQGVLAEIGFAGAVLARETPAGLMLIDGHLRVETAADSEIPVLILDVDEAEADKILATFDPISAMAGADAAALDDLLRNVQTGSEAVAGMLAELAKEAGLYQQAKVVEDEAPEPPADPTAKAGDLWILGDHRVLCGDSTKPEDVERLMDKEEIGCVVTDPPYGMAFQSNHRTMQHEVIAGDLSAGLLQHTAAISARHSVYMWCRWDNLIEIPKPKSLITWVKNNWSMGNLKHEHARQTEVCAFYPGYQHQWMNGRPADVLMHARTGNELHPTQKPVSLMAEVIAWTDGLIFDPFLGSGTTLIAAEQLGRKCYGMEISPAYCDVIVQRWETLTGKTAMLEGTGR